jgi:hypothetical protein
MKNAPYDDYRNDKFHISAYNYGKLYEAIRRRYDYANSHDFFKPGARENNVGSE